MLDNVAAGLDALDRAGPVLVAGADIPLVTPRAIDAFVRAANRYLVEVAPWNLAKDEGRRQDLADSLYASLEALRLIAVFASPVMPGASARLWAQLGIAEQLSAQYLPRAAQWGLLEPGTRTSKGEALFPRLED